MRIGSRQRRCGAGAGRARGLPAARGRRLRAERPRPGPEDTQPGTQFDRAHAEQRPPAHRTGQPHARHRVAARHCQGTDAQHRHERPGAARRQPGVPVGPHGRPGTAARGQPEAPAGRAGRPGKPEVRAGPARHRQHDRPERHNHLRERQLLQDQRLRARGTAWSEPPHRQVGRASAGDLHGHVARDHVRQGMARRGLQPFPRRLQVLGAVDHRSAARRVRRDHAVHLDPHQHHGAQADGRGAQGHRGAAAPHHERRSRSRVPVRGARRAHALHLRQQPPQGDSRPGACGAAGRRQYLGRADLPRRPRTLRAGRAQRRGAARALARRLPHHDARRLAALDPRRDQPRARARGQRGDRVHGHLAGHDAREGRGGAPARGHGQHPGRRLPGAPGSRRRAQHPVLQPGAAPHHGRVSRGGDGRRTGRPRANRPAGRSRAGGGVRGVGAVGRALGAGLPLPAQAQR